MRVSYAYSLGAWLWAYVPVQSILEDNVIAIELVIIVEVEQMIYSKIDILETFAFCALLEFCLFLSFVIWLLVGEISHTCVFSIYSNIVRQTF